MFTIFTSKDEVMDDIPEIYSEWIDIAKKLSDIEEDKAEFYYSYGFFHEKVEDKTLYYKGLFNLYSNMKFDERLEFEMKKVRVDLSLKYKNLFISNRLPKGTIPKIVKDIVTEITKVKMLVEFDYLKNEDIKASIPSINTDIVSFEIIKDAMNNDYSKSQNFDIDSILEKISKNGIDSLSEEEKNFLDQKSKDI
jgi:hypothetical protein